MRAALEEELKRVRVEQVITEATVSILNVAVLRGGPGARHGGRAGPGADAHGDRGRARADAAGRAVARRGAGETDPGCALAAADGVRAGGGAAGRAARTLRARRRRREQQAREIRRPRAPAPRRDPAGSGSRVSRRAAARTARRTPRRGRGAVARVGKSSTSGIGSVSGLEPSALQHPLVERVLGARDGAEPGRLGGLQVSSDGCTRGPVAPAAAAPPLPGVRAQVARVDDYVLDPLAPHVVELAREVVPAGLAQREHLRAAGGLQHAHARGDVEPRVADQEDDRACRERGEQRERVADLERHLLDDERLARAATAEAGDRALAPPAVRRRAPGRSLVPGRLERLVAVPADLLVVPEDPRERGRGRARRADQQ